jgi:hypothetical protein
MINRKCNGPTKNCKRECNDLQNIAQKTKDSVPRTPLKTRGELWYWKLSMCITSPVLNVRGFMIVIFTYRTSNLFVIFFYIITKTEFTKTVMAKGPTFAFRISNLFFIKFNFIERGENNIHRLTKLMKHIITKYFSV